MSELKEVVLATGGDADDISESKAAQRLSSHVEKMMKEMDDAMDKLHKEKQVKLFFFLCFSRRHIVFITFVCHH